MRARWPWLTPRRQLVLVCGAIGAAVAIVSLHRRNERVFLGEFAQALPMSVSLSAGVLAEWVQVRATHVRLLASAVAEPALGARPELRGAPGASADAPAWLDRAVQAGGFADGYVTVRARSTDGWRLHALPAHEAAPVTHAEFRAPIEANSPAPRELVMRLVLTEATLPYFNVAAPNDRSQRTALVAAPDDTVVPADRHPMVRLLAVSHAGGGPRAPATTSIPDDVQAALDGGVLARSVYADITLATGSSRGSGTGLSGRRVMYATAPVPGTPWVLVREREVEELLTLVRPAFYLTDGLFAVLALSLLALLVLWWRAQYQRRVTETERLRAAFVTGISHELRTPLTQVRMYAEMLRHDLLVSPEERGRALAVIETEAERLSVLIDRTLTFVRTGRAAAPLPNEAVHVAAAVQRARDALAAVATERHVQWHVDIPIGLAVRGLHDDLHQILLNLLDNAIKYGPVGQRLSVTAAFAPSTSTERPSMIEIVVQDEGRGIEPTETRAIWEPFRRGLAAEQSGSMGTGIGLTVVRDLVERAGGRVYTRTSEVRRSPATSGAIFVVELPAA